MIAFLLLDFAMAQNSDEKGEIKKEVEFKEVHPLMHPKTLKLGISFQGGVPVHQNLTQFLWIQEAANKIE